MEIDAEKAAAGVGAGKAAPGKKSKKKKGAGRSADEANVVYIVCVGCWASYMGHSFDGLFTEFFKDGQER